MDPPGGGGGATIHTPTPAHFPTNFREPRGDGSGGGGGLAASRKGGGGSNTYGFK